LSFDFAETDLDACLVCYNGTDNLQREGREAKLNSLASIIGARPVGSVSAFEVQEKRNLARAFNACIINDAMKLMPLPNCHGQIPPDFPENIPAFAKLKGIVSYRNPSRV
jgi:hypothetical protein